MSTAARALSTSEAAARTLTSLLSDEEVNRLTPQERDEFLEQNPELFGNGNRNNDEDTDDDDDDDDEGEEEEPIDQTGQLVDSIFRAHID